MSILVTGGAGFIGSHLVELLLSRGERVAVLDKLTYAGNLNNLRGCWEYPGFSIYLGDVCNKELVEHILVEAKVDRIIHLAAETHVDRSIEAASAFLRTNILGTHTLLEVARQSDIKRFLLVSTDEVYGEILEGEASEECPVRPRNPYSASKAGQEHLAYSYWNTYGLPVVIVRGCNNYGPGQHPEKFIPTVINRALGDKPVPLYGDGLQVREWIYVEDFAEALAFILDKGSPGEVYNIGSGERLSNCDVVSKIVHLVLPGGGQDSRLKIKDSRFKTEDSDFQSSNLQSLIRFVTDRPGHDRRYAVDSTKIKALGWQAKTPFEVGIGDTVKWYKENVDRRLLLQEHYGRGNED